MNTPAYNPQSYTEFFELLFAVHEIPPEQQAWTLAGDPELPHYTLLDREIAERLSQLVQNMQSYVRNLYLADFAPCPRMYGAEVTWFIKGPEQEADVKQPHLPPNMYVLPGTDPLRAPTMPFSQARLLSHILQQADLYIHRSNPYP